MKRQYAPVSKILRMHVALAAICVLLLAAPAAGTGSMNRGGVIVDYGEGSTTWVYVPFEEDEISVLELLDRSGLEMVTVGFGGLGEAVCQIGPSGCSVDDCRRKLCQTNSASPFWRLLVLDGDTWRMAGNGVSGQTVADDEIYALSWGNDEPTLPVVGIDKLASNAGADPAGSQPTYRTQGQLHAEDASITWGPSVAILGVVALASGVLIYRAKTGEQHVA
jgi:hypothetical protein